MSAKECNCANCIAWRVGAFDDSYQRPCLKLVIPKCVHDIVWHNACPACERPSQSMRTMQEAFPIHCLVFTDPNGATRVVLNSRCTTESRARTLLYDRMANGEAFSDERYMAVPMVIYEREHRVLP